VENLTENGTWVEEHIPACDVWKVENNMKLMIDEEQFATWKQAVSVLGDLGKWERRWAIILSCSPSLMQ
jgi:hypothetical protein